MALSADVKDWLELGMPAVVLVGVAWQTFITARMRLAMLYAKRASDARAAAAEAVSIAIRQAADMATFNAANATAAANVAAMHAASAAAGLADMTKRTEKIATDVKEIAVNTNHMREMAEANARKEGEEEGRVKEVDRAATAAADNLPR